VTTFAIPMTVSRTGLVGAAVALIVLVPTWSWRRRLRVALVALGGLLAFRALVPGLLGTLRSFLLDPGGDPSLLSREIGRERAVALLGQRPWFGRGFGTLLPERYGFLDNQVLLGLIEVGVVGQAAYACLFLVAAGLVLRTRGRAEGPRREDDRSLAVSLAAALAVSLSTWLTYDALSFPTSRALTFVLIGLVAALCRVVVAKGAAPGVEPSSRLSSPVPAEESERALTGATGGGAS
jgi:hypothetical protein